jgi:hypothetical protein
MHGDSASLERSMHGLLHAFQYLSWEDRARAALVCKVSLGTTACTTFLRLTCLFAPPGDVFLWFRFPVEELQKVD